MSRTTLQGAEVAATVPEGTELAIVELGYNDTPSTMPDRIDAVMRGRLRLSGTRPLRTHLSGISGREA